MPSRQIRWNLINDVTDRTAASVVAANPDLFSDVSEVPPFLYQSLKTIWLGSSAASGDLAKKVVADLGTGMESSEGSIVIFTSQIRNQADEIYSPNDDRFGAESANIRIVIYTPRYTTSVEKVFQAAYRIKYILDFESLNLRNEPELLVSPTIDNSIFSPQSALNQLRYFKAYFTGLDQNERASYVCMDFRVWYLRAFAI